MNLQSSPSFCSESSVIKVYRPTAAVESLAGGEMLIRAAHFEPELLLDFGQLNLAVLVVSVEDIDAGKHDGECRPNGLDAARAQVGDCGPSAASSR